MCPRHQGLAVCVTSLLASFPSCRAAGSCLRSIAPCSGDPSQVAVSLSDNVVRMVGASACDRGCNCLPTPALGLGGLLHKCSAAQLQTQLHTHIYCTFCSNQ